MRRVLAFVGLVMIGVLGGHWFGYFILALVHG